VPVLSLAKRALAAAKIFRSDRGWFWQVDSPGLKKDVFPVHQLGIVGLTQGYALII
jgi:hypothetical protein